MQSSDNTLTDATVIVCDDSLDIAGAAALRQQLIQALERGKSPVVFDASNVERADTAALQLLAAFFKDAGAADIQAQWKDPSAALCEAAALLGLREVLSLS